MKTLAWWKAASFKGDYLKSWGKAVRKEWIEFGTIKRGTKEKGDSSTQVGITKATESPAKGRGPERGEGWKRKGSRIGSTSGKVSQVVSEAERSETARRSGDYRCGIARRARLYRVCGGQLALSFAVGRRGSRSCDVQSCSDTCREARGCKRWYIEGQEEEAEEGESEEEHEKSRNCEPVGKRRRVQTRQTAGPAAQARRKRTVQARRC